MGRRMTLAAAALSLAVAAASGFAGAAEPKPAPTTASAPRPPPRAVRVARAAAEMKAEQTLFSTSRGAPRATTLGFAQLQRAFATNSTSRALALGRLNGLLGLPSPPPQWQLAAITFVPGGRIRAQLIQHDLYSQSYDEVQWEWAPADTGLVMEVDTTQMSSSFPIDVQVKFVATSNVIKRTHIFHLNSVTSEVKSTTLESKALYYALKVPKADLDAYFAKLDEAFTYLQTHPN